MTSSVPSKILCTLKSLMILSTGYSFKYPYPPCICNASSTISQAAAQVCTFAIAQCDVAFGSFASNKLAACLTINRDAYSFVAASAILNCKLYTVNPQFIPSITWNEEIGFPNCFRFLVYSTAVSKLRCAPPKLQAAIFTRPPSRALIAILNPSPSLPIKLLCGISQFSRITARVGCEFQPSLCSFLPKERPGVPFSTRTQLMPLGPISVSIGCESRITIVAGADHD